MTQLGVNAGLSARQLPGLAKGFLTISDATGLAATNVAHDGRTTWPAPTRRSRLHNQQLLDMTRQAANLNVTGGQLGEPDGSSRKAYGAIVSNAYVAHQSGAGHSPTRRPVARRSTSGSMPLPATAT